MKFSVIIPTLNEAEMIRTCIQHVRQATLDANVEIIVVDGGSSDQTIVLANQLKVKIIHSQKGRDRQCNVGAQAANGDLLLFLHADTFLPADTFSFLSTFFQNTDVKIGKFHTRYIEQHWALQLHDRFGHIDSAYSAFGDQCMTIRKSFFEELKGFPAIPLFEDVALFRAARKKTKIHTFPLPLTISGRRFLDNGIVWQSMFNFGILTLYLMGVSPRWLAQFYNKKQAEDTVNEMAHDLIKKGADQRTFVRHLSLASKIQ